MEAQPLFHDAQVLGHTMTFSEVGDETDYSAYFLKRNGVNRSAFKVETSIEHHVSKDLVFNSFC